MSAVVWLLMLLMGMQGAEGASVEGHPDQRWRKHPAEQYFHQHQGLPCPFMSWHPVKDTRPSCSSQCHAMQSHDTCRAGSVAPAFPSAGTL